MSIAVLRPIFGVDFSGAVDAGRKIWIAAASETALGLRIESAEPIAERVPGTLARPRALAALRELIVASQIGVWGFDTPPSLPHALMPHGWSAWIRTFPARFADAEAFRAWCINHSGGRELKRQTDYIARTPFAPANLRMYRQTYHGIADVFAPLIIADAAVIAPFAPPDPTRPLLLEVCPAATLKRIELYKPPYKGRSTATQREHILETMSATYKLDIAANVVTRCLRDDDGDAIDSVIAAWTTARWLRMPEQLAHPAPDAALEGFVYS